nr:ulp1 protease family, C-terminal catalytic domain-containing protein [Tanacetum cinerariifolium]
KLSSISKEKAKVETLLRDANKEFLNDDNVKQLFEQYKGFFKETILLEEAKAHKAPQNVKPKPAAVNTKEAAEKPKPDQNTKEVAEKPMPAENIKELAEKPKELAGDDYLVVRAATVMKAEDREEFENQGIIKGTLTEEEQWKSFYDEIKAQFKYEPSSMSLSDFELKPNTMVILDNSDSGYTYASKYKEACDPL